MGVVGRCERNELEWRRDACVCGDDDRGSDDVDHVSSLCRVDTRDEQYHRDSAGILSGIGGSGAHQESEASSLKSFFHCQFAQSEQGVKKLTSVSEPFRSSAVSSVALWTPSGSSELAIGSKCSFPSSSSSTSSASSVFSPVSSFDFVETKS